MAKRKGAMALFEAISKTQAKPGGQVLPPHVGIQPQPVKAESRAVLYVPPTEGGETAEPGAAPPPPPAGAMRGTFVPAAKPQASPDRTGSYEPASGGTAAGGPVPVSVPESALTPAVVKPPKTSAAPKPTANSVPMSRAAMAVPPTTRNDVSAGRSRPRLVALVLAAVLVVGAIWYLAVRPGSGSPSAAGDGSTQAGIGQSESLPPPPQEFLSGKYYLVVENTRGATAKHKADAESIAAWLTQRNEPAAAMFNDRHNHWVVMAYQRFDEKPYDDVNGKTVYNKAAVEFAKKIEGFGKEYFRQNRTYQFKQTNRNGEFTPSYVRISGP